MTDLRIRTAVRLDAPPERVWPLLCSARMDESAPDCFRLGIPTPRECRLESGSGGVGSTRECVSDRGIVRQRITAWEEGRRLEFVRTSDTAGLRRLVVSMRDTFWLEPLPGGATRLTRTTVIRPRRRCGFERLLLPLAVGSVHRFVHRNLARSLGRKEARP